MNTITIENASVIKVGDVISVGSAGFKKREIWLKFAEDSDYPQVVQVEAQKIKCSLFDDVSTEDIITVELNLNGREWKDPNSGNYKVFNTLSVWKVTMVSKAVVEVEEEESDLPF